MATFGLPSRLVWPLLAALQLGALGTQFIRGFRPGRVAPGRVPLSWDMFAPAVSRCTVAFVPPLRFGEPVLEVPTLSALAVPVEWDLVLDDVAGYRAYARGLCAAAAGGAHRARLDCFTSAGERQVDDIACP